MKTKTPRLKKNTVKLDAGGVLTLDGTKKFSVPEPGYGLQLEKGVTFKLEDEDRDSTWFPPGKVLIAAPEVGDSYKKDQQAYWIFYATGKRSEKDAFEEDARFLCDIVDEEDMKAGFEIDWHQPIINVAKDAGAKPA